MNKVVAYENSYIQLDDSNKAILYDLMEIGKQIKNELGLKNTPIQAISAEEVYIGNIVGNLTLNTSNLIIYPKYYGSETIGFDMKKLFSRTLKCSSDNLNSTVFFYRNNTINDQDDFFDTLAKYYLDITLQAIKKSKICLYEERVEKVKSIKGRILVQKQLSEPISDVKTWCKFRRLSDNNIYNQLLGWCCRYLSELSSNFDIKRKLLMLSREFPQQTDLLSIHSVKTIKLLRQFSEYDESLRIAQSLYLDSYGKKEKLNKGNRVCGYAINMERSFENIVCFYSRIAAQRSGFGHKAQPPRLLAETRDGADSSFEVRPDDLISKGAMNLVMDAKYKAISLLDKKNKKPSREDFYQMVSTCIAYGCHEAVLVYPKTVGFPNYMWETERMVNGYNIVVRAEAIDISLADEMLISQFKNILERTTFFEEVANG